MVGVVASTKFRRGPTSGLQRTCLIDKAVAETEDVHLALTSKNSGASTMDLSVQKMVSNQPQECTTQLPSLGGGFTSRSSRSNFRFLMPQTWEFQRHHDDQTFRQSGTLIPDNRKYSSLASFVRLPGTNARVRCPKKQAYRRNKQQWCGELEKTSP